MLINKRSECHEKIFYFCYRHVNCFLPGIFGVMFTPSHSDDVWYNALTNSVITPDGWVFGFAWTILYALLGIALFLIINNKKARVNKTKAYALFISQLVLNGLWTYLFFGLHLVGASIVCLVALLAVSIWMLVAFKPISKPASYLVWPYVLWLCFALYLNGVILMLN